MATKLQLPVEPEACASSMRAGFRFEARGTHSSRTIISWFWGCPGTGTWDERTDFLGGSDFDGNRWNDLHHTNVAKRAAQPSGRT